MAEEPLKYSTVAQAIGEVSIWWSGVEGMAHALALRLAQLNHPGLLIEEAQSTLNLILINMGQRQLFAAVKALAFEASPDGLFVKLEPVLNELDNVIRPERNRYMHDSWEVAEAGVERTTRSTKIVNNHGVKELRITERKPYATFQEIDHLAGRTKLLFAQLEEIYDSLTEMIAERLIRPEGPLAPSRREDRD
jgi:hypothetical protein